MLSFRDIVSILYFITKIFHIIDSYRQKTVRNATPASYQLAEHSQAINYTKL